MRRRALLAATGGGFLLAATGGALAVGDAMTRSALRAAGQPPPELQAQPVRIPLATGSFVAGWFAPGQPRQGAVLLLHGVRGSRQAMVARALFLHRLGIATLAIDLPAHGESPAPRITFGANESHGAPAAVVLESMYPTIEEAVADRLASRLGAPAAALAPALLWQMPWRLGVTTAQLHPIDALPSLRSPLLIAAGDADRHTTRAETERLYAAASAADKALWIVPGAAHVDLHAFAPSDYERRVGDFLQDRLRSTA